MEQRALELRDGQVFSISEAADEVSWRLGRRVRPSRIRGLLQRGELAEVRRAGGRRVFNEGDVRRIVGLLRGGRP